LQLKESVHLKRIVALVLLIILTCIIIGNHALYSGVNYTPALEGVIPVAADMRHVLVDKLTEPADAYHILRLHFLGTVTAGSMLGSTAYGTFNEMAARVNPSYFLEKAEKHLQNDDWTIAGFNSVLSDRTEGLFLAEKSEKEQSWYLGSTAHAKILSSGGVEILSLATEHMDDYGEKGYDDTKSALEQEGLLWGDNEKAVYLEKNGIRIGIYTCSVDIEENISQNSDNDRLANWAANASKNCDFVVLYVYRSTEDSHTTDIDFVERAKRWIDAGANCVLGIGSDLIQPIISYGQGVIVPSLGTFIAGENRFSEKYTVVYSLSLAHNGDSIHSWTLEPIPYATYDASWQPVPLEGEEKEAVLSFLYGETDAIT